MGSRDSEARRAVSVPLAATNVIVGPGDAEGRQHFAVCVRNMFEEERAGNPGPLEVLVVAPDGLAAGATAPPREAFASSASSSSATPDPPAPSILKRAIDGLRGLFGGA